LLDIYYKSVGHGADLNLNLPPDRTGQINAHDVKSLTEFRKILDQTFATNLAAGAKIEASNVRGNDDAFGVKNLVDDHREKYWATDDDAKDPSLTIDFGKPTTFSVVSLREYLPLGQRVEAFELEQWSDGAWKQFAKGTSIGSRRLIRVAPITTTQIRLRITQAPVCPAISELGVYLEPAQ